MPSVSKLLLIFSTLFATLGLAFWLWLTSSSMNGWQTWLFRAGHQLAYVQDENAGSRTVAFVLRPGEDVTHAIKACVHSFDKALLQDGTFVHCVAYGSQQDAEISRQQPQKVCEQGRAIQMPYGSASDAEIVLNRGERCGTQPEYLPRYVREYVR